MFRPLALVAMRQQHDEAAVALPLRLAADNELVNDDLRAVAKIAELRFPEHQRRWRVERIAEFKAEHCSFGKQAVVDVERRLVRAQGTEWKIRLAGARIIKHRVPLTERAAPG